MKPVLYAIRNSGRAGNIARSMQAGFRRHGIVACIEPLWDGRVKGDLVIAYGWAHQPVFAAYEAAGGQYAYWDLGYWNRRPDKSKGGAREGHHRLAVNSWDTADTMLIGCPDDRWRQAGIQLAPRRELAGAVLVAGMSPKAAGTHGFGPGQWERATLDELARIGAGEVIYRPKDKHVFEREPLGPVLERSRVVITHHSNVALDAIIAGVPCIARRGVGRLLTSYDLADVPALGWPDLPSDDARLAFVRDVAYAQWSPAEMRSGVVWDHMKGLLK